MTSNLAAAVAPDLHTVGLLLMVQQLRATREWLLVLLMPGGLACALYLLRLVCGTGNIAIAVRHIHSPDYAVLLQVLMQQLRETTKLLWC